jgi:hypothetical protein
VQVRLTPNRAPETIVTGAPLDSSSAFHRYHLYWYGADPDGQVVEYAVAVTDSNIAPLFTDYRRTTATDTIIEFVANNEVVLSHAFWVFSVDNEGQRDETPARVFFNAVDVNRPVPIITSASKILGNDPPVELAFNDTIPSDDSCVRFTWTATDADIGGSIRSYRIKLSTENRFTEIPADSTGVTYCNLRSGIYDFLVEAVDNAGAESFEPARWEWSVNREPETEFTGLVVRGESVDFSGGLVDVPACPVGSCCNWPESVPTFRDSSRVIVIFDGGDLDGTVTGFSFKVDRLDITRNCARRPDAYGLPGSATAISLPDVNEFPGQDTTQIFFSSNDYEVFVRAHDNEGKADGTPPSVKFHINFTPVLLPTSVFPGPGAVIDSSATVVNDSLTVTFSATDVETPPSFHTYRTILDGRFGDVVGPVSADSLMRQRWPFPAVGQHSLRYLATDPGRRADTLEVTFTVVP